MKTQKLELEFRNEFKKKADSFKAGKIVIMMTPPIDEDYWIFRIKLHKDQALVGFPKFGTIGIGFAQEEDWNTNLPYQATTKEIADHIWINRKYPQVSYKILTKAVDIMRKASEYYKTHEMPTDIQLSDFDAFKNAIDVVMEKVKIK